MKRYALLLPMKTALFVLVLASALVLGGPPAQANLLVNGSFEDKTNFVPNGNDTMSLPVGSTAMTGWEVIAAEIAWIGPNNPFFLTAPNGDYFLDLIHSPVAVSFGGVTQTIATVSGQAYLLEFDLGNDKNQNHGLPSVILVSAGSTSQEFASTGLIEYNWWDHYVLPFTATGSTTTISFQGLGDPGVLYIGLDNVTVSAVPLPPTALLLGSGLVGLGLWRRKWSLKK